MGDGSGRRSPSKLRFLIGFTLHLGDLSEESHSPSLCGPKKKVPGGRSHNVMKIFLERRLAEGIIRHAGPVD
jgi:hypothetical protein